MSNRKEKNNIIGIVLIPLLAGSLLFFVLQNRSLNTQSRNHRLLIDQQAGLIDSLRIRSLSNLMPNVLGRIDEELKNNPSRTLSDETISRIASLSYSFRPYAYPDGDSFSTRKLSPERGQLLLIVSGLNLDSGSLQQIMDQVSFANADLRDAVLSGANLIGINLSEADLSGAILDSANLTSANLSYANLWGAHLTKAKLNRTNLRGTDLRWAELNEADMQGSDLYESDLTSAQLTKADLRRALMRYANLNSTFLNESNLTGADMFRTTMMRAQLTGTNFMETNLTIANFEESNLTGAILTDAFGIDTNWFTRLHEWNVTGAKEMKDKYEMVKEEVQGRPQYRFKRKEN
ncbi:MAG: pentapeptide repeat-containing protein [Saprospiraceae bacterium]